MPSAAPASSEALTEYFVEALNVEEVIAQLLVTEGFTKVEELVYVELDELASIQGFDEEHLPRPCGSAPRPTSPSARRRSARRPRSWASSEDLLGFEALDLETILALGRKGITSLDDLADLAADELIELLPDSGLTEADAGELIMAARAHWFGDAGEAAAGAPDGADEADGEAAEVADEADGGDVGEQAALPDGPERHA